ncbi:MAG: histidine phosphatase family protein [Elusimicrobia bacterium]|nr:histidine phosphatase family protein [Elusimicrobiota bacterium]
MSRLRVLVVRHGPAGGPAEKARWRGRDEGRPLSAAGKRKIRAAAKGLARVAGPLDLIATSPLTRAKQTAELIAERLRARVVEAPVLEPGADPEATLRWLASRRERRIAVVGHEPQLGLLIAWLCAALERPVTELKKGQACLVELSGRRAGDGRLVWSLSPKQLRRLAD